MQITFFSITPNSDTAGKEDFDGAVKEVTFQPGEHGPRVVEIGLIDDFVDEPTEKFTVSLSSDSRAILGGPSSVNIIDDDGNYFENEERKALSLPFLLLFPSLTTIVL